MKTFLLTLLPFISFAQTTSSNLIARSREIRYQTKPGGNTKEMIGSLFEDLSRQVILIDLLQRKLDSLIANRPNSIEHPLTISKPEKSVKRKPTYHDELGNEL